MKNQRFEIKLATALLSLFTGFFLWQTPYLWQSPMSEQEIEFHLDNIERYHQQSPEDKAEFITRVRHWAENDDGRPVLLVNLLRFRELKVESSSDFEFSGTADEANEYYEQQVAPLALKRGEYPLLGGETQSQSLTISEATLPQLDRIIVMRAPSRRAFIEFMADPEYGPLVPYKALTTDIVLIPIDAELIVPDLRWIVGATLLCLYFVILWRRGVAHIKRASHLPTGHSL